MRRFLAILGLATLCAGSAGAQYANFEGHQVHPLEITANDQLLAVNTPDARLAIFDIDGSGNLSLAAEVPVGIEPVSVRAHPTKNEAWVVNHVSDTISIVDLTPGSERVMQTIKTDDEPSDVIFAGAGNGRAFVSISQRNRVDVYDANSPTSTTLFQIDIDGEDPRALARNAAGTEVYAAVFHSGNQTLTISGEAPTFLPPNENNRLDSTASPYTGGILPPPTGYSAASVPFSSRPRTSVIVKWRDCAGGTHWCDDNDTSWDDMLRNENIAAMGGNDDGVCDPGETCDPIIQMLDRDVAIIDADAADPSSPAPTYVTSVGTLNFGLAVQPVSDNLYVSNTDSRNHVRFEAGICVGGVAPPATQCDVDADCPGSDTCAVALSGHLVDTRLSVYNGSTVSFVELNPHIDYDIDVVSSVDETLSLGQPNGMAFDSTGDRLYVAALLSRKVVVLDTSSGNGTIDARIDVGEGPTGVALEGSKNRLYVLNRIDNTISRVNTLTDTEILPAISLYNPEPDDIRNGRHFLYDGQDTSGRGDVACATCHAFGNFDLLAWDLGDPSKTVFDARPAQTPTAAVGEPVECGNTPNQLGCGPFHPLKGPRTTQTLFKLGGTGRLHWHGDRQDFQAFNVAFPGLMRTAAQLSGAEMQLFTDFALEMAFPPNPNRNLDDSLNGTQAQNGLTDYLTGLRDNPFECNDCHSLPTGTNGMFINGEADQVHQAMKTPQLRNMYEKTGFSLHPDPAETVPATTRNGFGFTHAGDVDTLSTFLNLTVFSFPNQGEIDEVVAFMMQFPTGQAAGVGHQITYDDTNQGDPQLTLELNMLFDSLDMGDIDLIVTGIFGGVPRSFHCTAVSPTQASCQPDRNTDFPVLATALRSAADAGSELTFTAVPVGFGLRMGNDRDLDTFFNRTEIQAGSDPADPNSIPQLTPVVPALGPWATLLLVAALMMLAWGPLRRRLA